MKPHPSSAVGQGLLAFTLLVATPAAAEPAADTDAAEAPEKEETTDVRAEMKARRAAKVAACMDCHGDVESAGEISFKDGSSLPVGVDAKKWEASPHGDRLTCTQCHKGITEYPHPEQAAESARAYQLDRGGVCKKCHFAFYKRVADGIHAVAARKGNEKAPTCVDCHGAHDIAGGDRPRADVNHRCAGCHQAVFDMYAKSVHGKAVEKEGNADVPLCTDCHGAHAIKDPRKPELKAGSHDMCAGCHTDAERMKKYNLSTDVLSSYLEDFHGASNVLYALGSSKPGKPMVTCVDCHGVHEIVSLKTATNPNVIRERVTPVCQSCHKDATPTFGDAWLPHYQPTLQSAPLVWLIKWTYRIMIPMIMTGLILHILLHLWRLRTHR